MKWARSDRPMHRGKPLENMTKLVILRLALAVSLCHAAHAQVTFNSTPSRIVGQPILQQQGVLTAISANLVEGKELNTPQAVTVDTSSTPPIVYVADSANNRVLAWRNAAAITKGDAADLVIGQRDLYSTSANGPGSSILTTGLTLPTALAVDKKGNLYVADAGNNRIVRFPAPFLQTGALLAIDLVIGQKDFTGKTANEGLGGPTANTLFYSSGNSPFRSGLAFDGAGNLWASDPGNNRVLRFPAASLDAGGFEPPADIVLGQVDFNTKSAGGSVQQTTKSALINPSGIAFDPQGRLFVADLGNRVAVYLPPFVSGAYSVRLMGVVIPTADQPTVPLISDNTLGNRTQGGPPEGIFFVGNNPFVVDRGNARILKYDPYDSWPAESTLYSPRAIAVIGQPSFSSNLSNQGQTQPAANTFSGPASPHSTFESGGVVNAFFAGNDLYAADAGNHRVMIFPQQAGATFTSATRLLGQSDFKYNSINRIEGREFFFQGSGIFAGGGVAIDLSSDPPHLYVSDAGNNRVLGFKDYRKVTFGASADVVLGQPDLFTGMINYPKNDPNQTTDQGLFSPQGLVVDKAGNVYVADSGNGRVLRFPSPFAQPAGAPVAANLVVGQSSFFTKIPDASASTMKTPVGVALTAEGHLVSSDASFNRILFFRKPTGGDFTNGQSATFVFGQPNFGPASENTLNSPRQISMDPDDRLYVADSGNNRIVVYRNVPTAGNDPTPTFSLTGLSTPTGVIVDQQTNEIWVADSGSNRALRYPKFDTLVLNPTSNVSVGSFGPLSIAVDPNGNPVVAEALTNRISFFYQAIDATGSAGGVSGRFSGNAANYFQLFAPGMLASIFSRPSAHFGLQVASASGSPWPTKLADVQVLVNGTPAPLFYVSQSQINFQVPSNAPVGSLVEFQVLNPANSQIWASGLFKINPVSPGLFTADSSGSGQLLALNQDGSLNSALKPAKAGSIIQFFGTGAGVISGGPADGVVATGAVPTDQKPDVYINATKLDAADVTYSGLAPGLIGVWQINAKVPATVPTPDQAVPVALIYQGINSRADQFGNGRITTIRTTP